MPQKYVTAHVKIPAFHSRLLVSYQRRSAPGTTKSDLVRQAVVRLIYGRWKKDRSGYLVPV